MHVIIETKGDMKMAMTNNELILDIIETVNDRNKSSIDSPDFRQGHNLLLEYILMLNKVYKGFTYLTSDNVPNGQLPGVMFKDGNTIWPDETRRNYLLANKLYRSKAKRDLYKRIPKSANISA
jgi:hypothetical protein